VNAYQAITTRYYGPGNVRGSRVRAVTESGVKLTLHWDDALDSLENHAKAAQALANKLGWKNRLIPGALHGGDYAWVLTNGE
jgi:hypothetical protein